MRINFTNPLKLKWLSGISKRLIGMSCFVGWLCAGFFDGWSHSTNYALLNYCGLSWDIFKGIKISLLVYTWYFNVGFFAFALEIFLANRVVSWHCKGAAIVVDLLSSCPKQAWKDEAKEPVGTVMTSGQVIIYLCLLQIRAVRTQNFADVDFSALRRCVAKEFNPHLR